jgi:hypothetical protein
MNDITMVRGDTREFSVTVTDSEGDPFDLTDATITLSVDELNIEKTVGAGITVADPLTGVASIVIDPDDTESAPDIRRAYRYDVQLVLEDGRVKTPIRGLFIVLPDVTV